MITYYFTDSAKKQFSKLPKNIQKRIINKLDYYSSLKEPLKPAESLVSYELGSYRYRVGEYRVIFDVSSDRLIVLKIGHRREIYK